jgi:hypothetical protein
MSAPPSLFLLVDGGMKLAKPAIVVEMALQLGYTESVILGLGIILLACTVLSLIPRTCVVGAILLTGYLGGAVATHMRVADGSFPVFFPVIMGGRCVEAVQRQLRLCSQPCAWDAETGAGSAFAPTAAKCRASDRCSPLRRVRWWQMSEPVRVS